MEKLEFDYDSRANESVALVGESFRVRMIQDSHPSNPFEEWDGHWPMRERHDRATAEYGDTAFPCPFDYMRNGQIIRWQSAIESALGDYVSNGWHSWTFAQEKAEWLESNRACYATKGDALRDFYKESLGNVAESDSFDTLESLFRIAGIECLNTCSTGYCQGHYSELLIAAAPEAMEKFGWNPRQRKDKAAIAKDMAGQARLYGAWAWGDVYGFAVETLINGDWEELDSCWGFYGNDATESGLEEAALSSISYHMEQRRAARWQKLKELSKARVPYSIRAAILSAPIYSI